MNPQDLEALAPLYALEALDGEELERFQKALQGSESLQALVREYRHAATALPRSLDPVEPTPGLKSRLLETVAPPAERSAPVFTRTFWGLAAVAVFSIIGYSLLHPTECHGLVFQGGPEVTGDLLWTKRHVTLRVRGLPPLPPGKVYQLWHIMPGMPGPVGQKTFVLDASGILVGSDSMKDAITAQCSFAITMEPLGGSPSPTLPIYALARN